MPNLTRKTYRSLSARISFRVVAYTTCFLLVALSVLFYFSRQVIKREAIERAALVLEGTIQNIDNTLHTVETATNNMLWNVEHHLDTPDYFPLYTRRLLEDNPSVIGCAIAFDPNYYSQQDSLFMAYAYRPDSDHPESIYMSSTYGTVSYNKQLWYTLPKQLDQACWIEPIIGNDITTDDIISYSVPIHDSEGHFVGILATDIDIDWLSNTILATKPFPHSYSTLLSKNGKYIIHPDTARLFHQTVFDQETKQKDASVTDVIRRIMAGEEGYKHIRLDGQEHIVFYKPYHKTGWSTAIVCPTDDIFGSYNRLWLYMMLISITGLSLLLLLCFIITRRNLRPIRVLMPLVQRIAEGHYDNPIAESPRIDEIGHLQNSFLKMQQSLAAYIEQNNQVSATLKERNEALRIAYQQAMEADRVKMTFLHNMTDQIASPIDRIRTNADHLRQNYDSLSQEEADRLVEAITQDTETVTNLLNQLLEVALRDNS